jgi:restriction system protein
MRAMVEPEIPKYRDLMYPTLVAIENLGGSAAIAELEEEVPRVAGVTDEQLAVEFPPGSNGEGLSKVIDRLHWARSYLKKIGALSNSQRGVWAITPSGQEFLAMNPTDAHAALKQADSAVRAEARKAKRAQDGEGEDAEGETHDWRNQLLAALKVMDPYAFERLAMRLLREAGFRNVEVLGKSGDGGIDGVGVYKVSLVSFPTYFQCKRFAGSVSAGVVRDFRGAMTGRGEKGLVITTGVFTPSAKAEATRDGAPPIDLVDGEELCELLKEFGMGVTVTERIEEDVTLDLSFFDNV